MWKDRLRLAYPAAAAYSAFLGSFSSAMGASTIVMMIVGRTIFSQFGIRATEFFYVLSFNFSACGLCIQAGALQLR